MSSCTLLLLLAACSGALASHFYGGTMTFTPKGQNPDGTFRVDFRFKQTYDSCHLKNEWYCLWGDCGHDDRLEAAEVDQGNGVDYYGGKWCTSEASLTKNIRSNHPFEMGKTGCCWIYNSLSTGSSWALLTQVDLGIRSDTQEPNRSPVTAVLPFIRIPQNCPRTLKLLAHDPDEDKVRCRYGSGPNECSNCHHHPGFYLDTNSCTVNYQQTSVLHAHTFEIVLEDFPRQHITLSYTDGTLSWKSPLMTRHKRWNPMSPVAPTAKSWSNWQTNTPAPYRGIQPYRTPSPWSWNPHSNTPAPYWGIQPSRTPSPWLWNRHPNTPAPYWGTQPYRTPSPWLWNRHPNTPAPYWGTRPYRTPSPWSWNRHPNTPAPYWGTQPYRTPSPWSWNQPNISPSTISPPHRGHQPSTAAFFWPHKTKATTSTHSKIAQWQQTTTTTPFPTTPSHASSMDSMSKIPLHFAIQVDPAVHSCTEGELLPLFLPPTPRYGEFLTASVNQELEIRLKATATQSWVNNFIISGPLNITKYNIITGNLNTTSGSVGESLIRWTPTENNLGDHVPICFIAESVSGSRIFHSEMRCIIVTIGHTNGKANVICNEHAMTVEVEKSSIIGLHEDHLRLIDPTCTPISNGTHVIAAMSLSSCGTILEEDADNLIFKNEITSYDKLGEIITRKHQVEIGFSCSYPKKGKVSLGFHAHKLPFVFTEKGFGKFTYQFEFFHSSGFNRMVDPNTYPVEVPLREILYMDIKATSSIANTELFVESCRATPVDDPKYHVFYDIFQNGCTMDETVVIYPSNPSEFKFGIAAFTFIGEHEEVFISCSVILCVAGNPFTRCSQGCINATAAPVVHHHHRRDVAIETVRHYISQGPLRLKKRADITVSNMSLNMNLVFIAAVLLVAIVCGAVIHTAKRSKVKYQPLPSTDF